MYCLFLKKNRLQESGSSVVVYPKIIFVIEFLLIQTIVLLGLGSSVYADIFTFEDRTQLEGRILADSDTSVQIEVESGKVEISKESIISIEASSWTPPERNLQTKKRKTPSPLARLVVDGIFIIIGFFMYSSLSYLIFWLIDFRKSFQESALFALISLVLYSFSNLFILSQVYYTIANVVLVNVVYEAGLFRSVIFGGFLAWVIIISGHVFFSLSI